MNRRQILCSLPAAALAILAARNRDTTVPCGKSITVQEAYQRLADEINTDEDYRQAWLANIAVLLHDLTKPESESVRRLRIDLGMTPERLVDPTNLADCNYFAEELLERFFNNPWRNDRLQER